MSDDIDLRDLLAVATDAARLAGRHTLRYFGDASLAIDAKADESPVTRADTESEEMLRAEIGKRFPRHAIIGEEYGSTGSSDARVRWVLDPLDGTKSFVRGVPLYAVLVGVEVDGVPRVGACYLPATDEMINAADGLGCTHDGRPARVSSVARIEDATLLTTNYARCAARADGFVPLARRVAIAAGWGDAYGHAMVACGKADAIVDPRTKPWDLCAMAPILREAGGALTSWRGEATIDGGDAISSNGLLHAALVDALRDARPDSKSIR